MSITITKDGNVAVISFSHPPVNALNGALRRGLLQAVQELTADAATKALVLWGGDKSFIAGADISEMSRPPEPPFLPELVEALDHCCKPIIAALSGAALGGGCEIALACDVRLAAPTASIGLTETRLGIIPGAGGTQRLARLVGLAKAVELICGARILKAQEAQALGLVDKVVGGDLLAEAIAQAKIQALKNGSAKRRVSELTPPPDHPGAFEAEASKARKAAKGVLAIDEAIKVISGAQGDFKSGLAQERAVFLTLRASEQAAALRYMFFAEREASKWVDLKGIVPLPVHHAGVIGAGTMGAGIAASLLLAGLKVTLVERDKDAATKGEARVCSLLERALETGRITQSQISLHATTAWDSLADADLIIEAAFEDLAVKQEIFRRLAAIAKPNAVLATNTSYLDVDAIAVARPANVVGLHFFAPAHIMKLLEIVHTKNTSPQIVATALGLAKRLGKQPVLAGNKEGFIGNRIYAAYRRHAEYLLEDGALPEEVDTAMESYGMAMGIFAVSDVSGLDIAYAMRRRQDTTRNPAERYVKIPDKLVEIGRLGRKTKAGWYDYDESGKKSPAPVVVDVISKARIERGITPCHFTEVEIQRRLLAIMANEGTKLLMDNVAQRASDIDVAFVNGYGFPRTKGGPIWAADNMGLAEVQDELQKAGVAPAALLVECIKENRRLSEWCQQGEAA